MSERELNRVEVLSQVKQDRLTVTAAANVLGLSRRQVHRLLKAFEIPDLNSYHAVAAQTMSEKRRACHGPEGGGHPQAGDGLAARAAAPGCDV